MGGGGTGLTFADGWNGLTTDAERNAFLKSQQFGVRLWKDKHRDRAGHPRRAVVPEGDGAPGPAAPRRVAAGGLSPFPGIRFSGIWFFRESRFCETGSGTCAPRTTGARRDRGGTGWDPVRSGTGRASDDGPVGTMLFRMLAHALAIDVTTAIGNFVDTSTSATKQAVAHQRRCPCP